MKAIQIMVPLVFLVSAACQKKSSDLSSKKNGETERLSASEKNLIQKVETLKKDGGRLLCTGVDMETFRFVRTLAQFEKGSLQSLVIKGYLNKEKPEDVPNELAEDFETYKIFEFDLLKDSINREVDLSGKKFGVEIFKSLNGQARKIYDLRFTPKQDALDVNTPRLDGSLDFKNIESEIDIHELSVGCNVFTK